MLKIVLTKLTNTHHRIEFVRANGVRDGAELQTRSFLLHDLVHYGVESEAKLRRAFYGTIADGMLYSEIAANPPRNPEAVFVERVVAMLQKCAKGDLKSYNFVGTLREFPDGRNADWFSQDFVKRALERVRRVQGQWKATPFRRAMELAFVA
jgi:hypothetical protein